ncbi:MAG: CotH kinase family protein [Melioribacteraceae bacterium]|nr:CotH kinase family protein [Melioribacteraceae bacterium]
MIQEGENVLSIQVHNYGITSSDLTIIPFLTLGLHSIPSPTNGVPEILEFSLPSLHTNFQLSADGEELTVSDASGNLLDSLILPALSPDISFGRKPDGNSEFYYFSESTPGEPNVTEGFAGVSVPPLFSIDGGFYNEPIFITIDNPALNGDIYITTNGAPPDISSEVYAGPIPISESKVIRARIIEDGNLPSEIVTNSYFIDFETTLPVVSLSTEPGNFFDDEYGIYVMGDSAEPGFPYFGANFWKDWERPIHFEIYENNGERAFKSDGGVKIYGAYSRGLPQKSLALFARGEYGYKEFDHQLFPNMPINSFQSFVLRNSGNDWEFTLFRDAMMQSLVDDIDLENLASRTAVVFLNGAYWGIHNIREKANEEYLASHNNIDADNIDLLENNGFVLEGDGEKYWELISYLETHNAAIDENYEYVKSLMDVDNFIDYELTEIFIDNQDWPGNNIKYWREKSGEGKWRWVLYDTDFGFGIFNPYAYENNTLEFALEPNGPEWPNPPWSTFLLRSLMNNDEFKTDFINRFSDLTNSIFKKEKIIAKIDSFKNVFLPEIERHISRWNGFNLSGWNNNIERMRDFAEQRPVKIRRHFINYFDLNGTAFIQLHTNLPNSGYIKLNKLAVTDFPWYGHYLSGVPVKIKAIPAPGYKFVEWEGDVESNSSEIEIMLAISHNLTAVFEKSDLDLGIVINEINYNSSSDFDTEDWVELYNPADTSVDLSGWIFKDEDDEHVFTMPSGRVISADNYLVLCRDTLLFTEKYSSVDNFTGDLNFGLSSGGELIRLFNPSGKIIDSLTYDNNSPWPEEPDGNGHSLSLKNPWLDNAKPESWEASIGYGTPGEINDIFTEIKESAVPVDFMLYQNYPNPFNPVTTIRFSNPKNQHVRLEVFNVLGQSIAVIVDAQLLPGTYNYKFDGTEFSSGIYFARLSSKGKNIVNKMMLLK